MEFKRTASYQANVINAMVGNDRLASQKASSALAKSFVRIHFFDKTSSWDEVDLPGKILPEVQRGLVRRAFEGGVFTTGSVCLLYNLARSPVFSDEEAQELMIRGASGGLRDGWPEDDWHRQNCFRSLSAFQNNEWPRIGEELAKRVTSTKIQLMFLPCPEEYEGIPEHYISCLRQQKITCNPSLTPETQKQILADMMGCIGSIPETGDHVWARLHNGVVEIIDNLSANPAVVANLESVEALLKFANAYYVKTNIPERNPRIVPKKVLEVAQACYNAAKHSGNETEASKAIKGIANRLKDEQQARYRMATERVSGALGSEPGAFKIRQNGHRENFCY